jgi:hypothetical protein
MNNANRTNGGKSRKALALALGVQTTLPLFETVEPRPSRDTSRNPAQNPTRNLTKSEPPNGVNDPMRRAQHLARRMRTHPVDARKRKATVDDLCRNLVASLRHAQEQPSRH